MGYAINSSGGWHVVSSQADCIEGESYSDEQPSQTAAQAQAIQLGMAVMAAFTAGVTISSKSTPAINGTYPISASVQSKIDSVQLFIEKNNAFPGSSGTSLAWYDTSGMAHIFASTTLFGEFATALANYVADLELYSAGAPGSSLPAAIIAID